MNVAVLGEGAWGSALALLLAHNGCSVTLWCHDPEVMHEIQQVHTNNRYLPAHTFPPAIIPTQDLGVVAQQDIIFEALPVQFLRSVVTHMSFQDVQPAWVILSKGIDRMALHIPSQLVQELLPYQAQLGVVYGPSFAHELAQRQYTALMLAASSAQLEQQLYTILNTAYCRIAIHDDMVGMQWCGILKNVLALAVGMAEGAGYGKNAQCALLTRGLHEMYLLVAAFGGNPHTVYTLCGVGDVVLTAFANGRNKQVGQQLGAGKKVDEVLANVSYIPESINTVYGLEALLKKNNLNVPLFSNICWVITQGVRVQDALQYIFENVLGN